MASEKLRHADSCWHGVERLVGTRIRLPQWYRHNTLPVSPDRSRRRRLSFRIDRAFLLSALEQNSVVNGSAADNP